MKLLTAKEVSEILRVKPSTVYMWAETGQVPSLKINGVLRFSEKEIFSWLESCKKGRYTNLAGRGPGRRAG